MLLTDLHTISLQDDHEVTEGYLAIEVAVCLVEDLLERLLSLPGRPPQNKIPDMPTLLISIIDFSF